MSSNRRFGGLRYWILALFVCSVSANEFAGNSVAMVTDLQGKVALTASPGAPALSILSELKQDSHLQLDGGAHATIVYLESGQEYELSGPANVQIGADQPRSITGAAPNKHGAALSRSRGTIRINPVQVTQGAMVMRSIDPDRKLRLLSLSDTTTLELRPVFQWQMPQSGLHFKLELLDDAGKPIFNTTCDAPSVQLPDNVVLQPGAEYTWVVSADAADGKIYTSAGDFSVASADLRSQVEQLRPAADAPLPERVVFAAWLEQMHLRDEARRFWKAIAEDRKDDARLKVLAGE